MESLATRVTETLAEEIGEGPLIGVSYYDEDGVGHVFRSEWAAERYDPAEIDEIVEEIRFEGLGQVVHEGTQKERLHATVRVYDDVVNVVVPVEETRGVALALHRDGDYAVRGVVGHIERTLDDAGAIERYSG
ncbi:hypothetical protein [Halarchaeum sp. P4]|uniref:hypothetical protein n=1 Tax=Halarchaeum sp. P4 TaxID=3421639 RepID=UPI003EBEE586